MPTISKLEKRRMNEHLQSHGLGSLDDPTILLQLAVLVKDHDHFQTVLMKVTADKRALCYQALAPKLRFKAKPLDVYEMEAKQNAERMQLPTYDPKTLAVTEFKNAPISELAKQAISGKTLEERKAAALTSRAEDAISESIGQSMARGRLFISCTHCEFGATVYATDQIDAYKTLAANGWHLEGEKALCPDCRPKIVLV
jgi:hypothetical protein